jgi:response regulator RpfG family c-di-GMP phosphodiesterase
MHSKILFVDDNPNILTAFQRELRRSFAVHTALGGEAGLQAVSEQGPFAVIVSDLRMPGMDGIQFLATVRDTAPDSVRIMLTGNADLQTAIKTVNEGNIFRFLTKPCDQQLLVRALSDGVRQYQLITAERELLEKTLRSSVKVLSEILQLINPEAFGRASRIAYLAKKTARAMQEPHIWEIETAAALSQIGCVILPEAALKKLYNGEELTAEESQLFSMHPFIASDLISHIPRMDRIAEIIANQAKNFDGSGVPQDDRKGKEVPLGARILRAVLDFDLLQAGGLPAGEALEKLAARPGLYDPDVLEALEMALGIALDFEEKSIGAAQLADGMILAQDVTIRDGRLLVARGYRVNRTLRERMKNFAVRPGIREPIRVLVPIKPAPDDSGK